MTEVEHHELEMPARYASVSREIEELRARSAKHAEDTNVRVNSILERLQRIHDAEDDSDN